MPSTSVSTAGAGDNSQQIAEKKRSLAESRAAAKEWARKRKAAATWSQHDDSPPRSTAKKPRQEESGSPIPLSKAVTLERSRQRAKEYAERVLSASNTSQARGVEEDTTRNDEFEDGTTASEDDHDVMHGSLGSNFPTVGEAELQHSAAPEVHKVHIPPLPSTPILGLPNTSRGGETKGGSPLSQSSRQHLESRCDTQIAVPKVGPRRPSSFLHYADNSVAADAPSVCHTSQGASPLLREQEYFVYKHPQGRIRRQSFLSHADKRAPAGKNLETIIPRDVSHGKDAIAEDRVSDGDGASLAESRSDQRPKRRVRACAYTCAVVFAPLMACLLTGVFLLAWPWIRRAASGAWGTMARTGRSEVDAPTCFIARGDDASVCAGGGEVAACPTSALCGAGHILACDMPYEKARHGKGCVLSSAALEESNAVAGVLRDLARKDRCSAGGLLAPFEARRSCITLAEAATALRRGPLNLLAAVPGGNVAGVLELDDTADGDSRRHERIVRLSKAAAEAVRLPWTCRTRMFTLTLFLSYWKYFLVTYATLLAVLCLDVRRWKSYRRRVEVYAMRDDCYQALLEHRAQEFPFIQTSHVQAFVGDRCRARGYTGTTSQILERVRHLWPQVEKEVAYDARIRRGFDYIGGQRNVPCWKWVGPATAKFENIGRLDPGPAPRLWLLRWLKANEMER